MSTKIAYLEISPRQSGKTTRLVQFANKLKGEGKTVIFVSYLARDPVPLRRRMPGVIVLTDGKNPPLDTDLLNAVWMYDEFDWLKSTKIREGAYYSTTAKRIRTLGVEIAEDDVLMKLLEVNDLHFERYFKYVGRHPDDWLTNARAEYSPEEFRLLFLGDFLS